MLLEKNIHIAKSSEHKKRIRDFFSFASFSSHSTSLSTRKRKSEFPFSSARFIRFFFFRFLLIFSISSPLRCCSTVDFSRKSPFSLPACVLVIVRRVEENYREKYIVYGIQSEGGTHEKCPLLPWWNECDRLSLQLRWLPLLLLPFSSTLRATVVVVVVVRSCLLSTHVRLFRNDIYVHSPAEESWLACDSNFAIFSGHTMMTTTQKAAAAAHGHRLVQSRYIKFSVARSTHMRKAKFICEENPLR